MDSPWAQAVAMDGGLITAVGTTAQVLAEFPGAEVIDVGGRTVLPGMIDAHNHFLATGESLATVDVRYPAVRSVDDLVAVIAQAVAAKADDSYVRAYGFDHAKYERTPTRWDLDSVTGRHPVVIGHVSGHYVLANTIAMEERGILESTPDPPGGRLDRDELGRLTGLFQDTAIGMVQPTAIDIGHHGPNFHVVADMSDLVSSVERAGSAYLAAGLTTVCDAQLTSRELSAYQVARKQGRLLVRTVCMPLSHQLRSEERR